MMISTGYLIKKVFRWCWLAIIVGCLCAGSYYFVKKQKISRIADKDAAGMDTAETYTEELSADPNMLLFAMYRPDFSGYKSTQSIGINLSEYASGICDFVIGRYTSDSSYWKYYEKLLEHYPLLDQGIFTSDVMRDMISVWQNGYDVVFRVKAPEIKPGTEAGYAYALGLIQNEKSYIQLDEENRKSVQDAAKCALRNDLFSVLNEYVMHGGVLSGEGIILNRGNANHEKLMATQSVIGKEDEDDILETPNKRISKKKLLVFFLFGAVLVEAGVLISALFDNRVKSKEEFLVNTNLNVLQLVDNKDNLLEAALKLDRFNPCPKDITLVGVGVDGKDLKTVAEKLDASLMQTNNGTCSKVSTVVYDEKDLSWILKLGKSAIVILAGQMLTQYGELQKAAEQLQLGDNQVCGAILLSATSAKQRG